MIIIAYIVKNLDNRDHEVMNNLVGDIDNVSSKDSWHIAIGLENRPGW